MSNPQQQARLESVKRQFQQKRDITDRLATIKNKIAVYSGKGGVGKTTIATGLAAVLAANGFKVGIFDADIDCPNVTQAFGLVDLPVSRDGKFFPPVAHLSLIHI